jgi:ribonuclease R
MVLANVATAKFVEKHQMPGLFRVHDKPSEDKYKNFVTYLNELGITLPTREQPEPADYANILNHVQGRPDQELIQTMLLRSMRQAVYQSDNLGHFGLALESYSHFTSPIRRYPDLVIHRVIKAILAKQAQAANESNEANVGFYEYSPEEVIELGEHCSMTERRADDATRDVSDWLKCEFMQDHVGDTFTGVISTVTNFGLFVRLSDLHIEGLIHITSLGHDYYHFDDVRMCLSGERSSTKYRIGDVIEVKVAAVNLDEKKIDLALAGGESTTSRAKPAGKGKGKVKSQGLRKNSDIGFNTSKERADKEKPKKPKDKKTEKSKSKKRTERKKRPGKNARKTDK